MYFPKTAVPLNQTPQPTVQPTAQPKTGYMPKSAVAVQPEKKSLGGFVNNIGTSAGNVVTGLGQMIAHPITTAKSLYNVGSGYVSKLIPGRQKSEDAADAVTNFYKQRYGGVENIKNTLYNDPVGALMDVATVASGAGGALRGAGAISKVSGLTRAGSTLSKVGTAIDPLTQTGRAVRAVTQPVRPLFSKAVSSAADFLGSKAQKFNSTNIKAIEEATKMKPLEYARSKNLPIAATERSVEQMKNIIKSKQEPFNKLVKTDTPIDRKILIRELESKAKELSMGTRQERSLALDLIDEARYHKKRIGQPLTDTELTRQITKSFSEATKQQIADPMKSGFSEQFARSGQQAREKIYPGSMAMGQELRGLRTYTDELTKQANTGKGTQFFNLLKPVGAGALAGAGLGSFAPGIGNLTGLVVGATASAIANSPQFLSFASRSLTGLSKAKLPAGYSKLFSRVIDAGKAGRMFTPTSQETQLIESLRPQLEQKQSSPSIIQPSATPYQVPKIRRPR